jgi:hypothetical protein
MPNPLLWKGVFVNESGVTAAAKPAAGKISGDYAWRLQVPEGRKPPYHDRIMHRRACTERESSALWCVPAFVILITESLVFSLPSGTIRSLAPEHNYPNKLVR